MGASDIDAWLSRGHLLVLDRCDQTLGAVVHVDMRDGHATMDLLVVDPAETGSDVEQRVHGVVHALCEAYGCDHVDTSTPARMTETADEKGGLSVTPAERDHSVPLATAPRRQS